MPKYKNVSGKCDTNDQNSRNDLTTLKKKTMLTYNNIYRI